MRRIIAYVGLALSLATAWRWLGSRPFADGASSLDMVTLAALILGAGLALLAIGTTSPRCPRCAADTHAVAGGYGVCSGDVCATHHVSAPGRRCCDPAYQHHVAHSHQQRASRALCWRALRFPRCYRLARARRRVTSRRTARAPPCSAVSQDRSPDGVRYRSFSSCSRPLVGHRPYLARLVACEKEIGPRPYPEGPSGIG